MDCLLKDRGSMSCTFCFRQTPDMTITITPFSSSWAVLGNGRAFALPTHPPASAPGARQASFFFWTIPHPCLFLPTKLSAPKNSGVM